MLAVITSPGVGLDPRVRQIFRAIYTSLRAFLRAEILDALEELGALNTTAQNHADITRARRDEPGPSVGCE